MVSRNQGREEQTKMKRQERDQHDEFRAGRGCWPALLPAAAQTYPNRPVRLIVPYQAGQGTDVAARYFAEQLSKALGQQVFVDNKPGAGGNIGTEAAAHAPPDGYTLLMGTVPTQTMNEFLYASTGYDSAKDFAPIILVGMLPMVISANPVFPAKTIPELIAAAKAQPDKINVALPSTTARIVYELLQGADRRAAVRRALQGLGDGDDRDDGRPGAADHRHRDRDCAAMSSPAS